MKKIIVHFDMDDTMFNFSGAKQSQLEAYPENAYPQAQVDFFRKLEPIIEALELFKHLSMNPMFDVYILTAPSVMNPLSYMEKRLCIEDHLGLNACNKLIICPNKGLVKGDYLIDDIVRGKGQENFEGKLITPHSKEFPSWDRIKTFFDVVALSNTKFELGIMRRPWRMR